MSRGTRRVERGFVVVDEKSVHVHVHEYAHEHVSSCTSTWHEQVHVYGSSSTCDGARAGARRVADRVTVVGSAGLGAYVEALVSIELCSPRRDRAPARLV